MSNTDYLKRLSDVLPKLKTLIKDVRGWQGIVIDRKEPHTVRLWKPLANGDRLVLHSFQACDMKDAFVHPHPWPAAFMILTGWYDLKLGLAPNREEGPSRFVNMKLSARSHYEMVDPLWWHSVAPGMATKTVMINGPDYSEDVVHHSVVHHSVVRTEGKGLRELTDGEVMRNLADFLEII